MTEWCLAQENDSNHHVSRGIVSSKSVLCHKKTNKEDIWLAMDVIRIISIKMCENKFKVRKVEHLFRKKYA